jgi:hypothetical protein
MDRPPSRAIRRFKPHRPVSPPRLGIRIGHQIDTATCATSDGSSTPDSPGAVTPEVAGSSPVAPAPFLPCKLAVSYGNQIAALTSGQPSRATIGDLTGPHLRRARPNVAAGFHSVVQPPPAAARRGPNLRPVTPLCHHGHRLDGRHRSQRSLSVDWRHPDQVGVSVGISDQKS